MPRARHVPPAQSVVLLTMLLLGACATTSGTQAPHMTAPGNGPNRLSRQVSRSPDGFLVTMAAASGASSVVNSWFALHADCSLDAYPLITQIDPPAHGSLSLKQGMFYPNYPAGNQRYVCNLHPQPGVQARYVSAPGYTGADTFTIRVLTPGGISYRSHYTVNVE
ncbi:hypothetical protein AA103196_1837 [Ameyamaea chiangmaiensis NBRC 103196]|uniref:Lipoprotein n=1 Tax=Ameyamaea chiangmaiensis TaxID=442969 RepID=A0A850P8X8_9PROT|nr:hypothetical protein [Ameyamaea chiangmaiensis]MBS4073898.1 hypothetical protein [Ameyamaea chiangmaiensis]NVN40358.1 hypothetical protein [Ameyamaea chiangmaiensis]GBQ68013.1 hypothetical protein AA103196_1837 [Ameyamaea chiangmaiensis NBRC 103196]